MKINTCMYDYKINIITLLAVDELSPLHSEKTTDRQMADWLYDGPSVALSAWPT